MQNLVLSQFKDASPLKTKNMPFGPPKIHDDRNQTIEISTIDKDSASDNFYSRGYQQSREGPSQDFGIDGEESKSDHLTLRSGLLGKKGSIKHEEGFLDSPKDVIHEDLHEQTFDDRNEDI
jgi:hypothetical protein